MSTIDLNELRRLLAAAPPDYYDVYSDAQRVASDQACCALLYAAPALLAVVEASERVVETYGFDGQDTPISMLAKALEPFR